MAINKNPISANQKKLSDSMKDYLNANKQLGRSYQKFNIRDVWKEVLGDTIDKYTSSLKISGTVLFVKISSAPLRQEMTYSKNNILEKLNDKMPYEKFNDLVIS